MASLAYGGIDMSRIGWDIPGIVAQARETQAKRGDYESASLMQVDGMEFANIKRLVSKREASGYTSK